MKKIILSVLLFIMARTISAQFSFDHYHPIELITKERIDTCWIFIQNPDSSQTIEQYYIYNKEGLEIENKRDFQGFSFKYRYNANGAKIAEDLVPFGEIYYERDTLIYDKKGLLIKKLHSTEVVMNQKEMNMNTMEFSSKRNGISLAEQYKSNLIILIIRKKEFRKLKNFFAENIMKTGYTNMMQMEI